MYDGWVVRNLLARISLGRNKEGGTKRVIAFMERRKRYRDSRASRVQWSKKMYTHSSELVHIFYNAKNCIAKVDLQLMRELQ